MSQGRLTELFLAAARLEGQARAAFLDRACADDAELRAEVESLLSHDGAAGATELASTAVDASAPPGQIGAYRILEPLGEGGMGAVYLAEQQEPVRRRVALKLIKWGMDTKQVVARFESERQALALMNHPNIARVFDGGATPEGRPYFVMEYVKGEPLTVYCDKQRLDTEARLELFLAVCDGVQHAHQKAIIHRDLKPSNVLVRVQDGKPLPKIIDFGVAKATTQRLTEKTVYTQLGALIGTPEYMSPEQAEMTTADIDTRTDVYSLGVMLYELLVGVRPFDSKELREGGYDELRRRIREDEPSKPSTRLTTLGGEKTQEAARRRRTEVRALRRDLRGDLDWITMKALEKDRTRRYGSAAELAADVRRHLRHEPVLASPPSASYRVGKFVRRHRGGVVAGTIAIAALVAGAVLATLGMVRATRAEHTARQEAETSKQVSDFLVGLFEVSDPGESRGNTITARELLDNGAERIERELDDRPLVKARMMGTMGRVYQSLGLFHPAERLLENALEIRERRLGAGHLETATSLSRLGWLRMLQGRYAESIALHEEALTIQQRVLPDDAEAVAWSRYYLGAVRVQSGDHAAAAPDLQAALAVFDKRLGPESLPVAWCMNDLGMLHEYQGDYGAAAKYYERALRIKNTVLPADHPDLVVALNNLGHVEALAGRLAAAREMLERALEIAERTTGGDSWVASVVLWGLGETWRLADDPVRARPLLERALAIQSRDLGADSIHLGATLHSLGAVLHELGETRAAEANFARALEIREKLGADDSRLALTLTEYAALLRDTDREALAVELEARAGRIRARSR